MKRLFLHIGPHKTGSSYLQKTLFDHRSRLAEVGLGYPDAGIEFLWGHHALAAALHHQQWPEVRRYMREIVQRHGDVLLSSEDFDKLSAETWQAFSTLLDESCGYDGVKLVFVRRAANDLLVSTWQECVKNGDTRSWERFFFDHLSRPDDSDIINPGNVLRRFEAGFGGATPIVIDYDAARACGEDLFDVFAAAIGHTELRGLGSGARVNERMSLARVEIVRLLNVMALDSGRPSDCRINGSLQRYLEAEPDCAAYHQLLRFIDGQSKGMDLAALPMFAEYAKRFDKRYGHCIVNPLLDGDQPQPQRQYPPRLPGGNLIIRQSTLRRLGVIEAGARRFYQA